MRQARQRALAAGAVAVFTFVCGCKLSVSPELYLTDLRDVAVNGTTGVSVPTTLAFEIPTSSECEEYTAQITDLMGGSFPEFAAKGCEDKGMDSYLMANASLPLVPSEEAWKQANSLFGILASAGEEHITVFMALDLEEYAAVSDKVESEFFQDLELENSTLKFEVNNDGRETMGFRVSGAFVNAEPVVFTKEYSLERRQKVDVTLSDVRVAYLAKHGYVMLLDLPLE